MAWFKVDDGFHSSRKVLSIPRRSRLAAIGAWSIAGSWCADELTDGHVPDFMILEWGFPATIPATLVDSGLWERERGGYAFRNWAEYQPSKADVDAERTASRERMRELRAKRKQKKPQNDAAEPDVFGRTVTNGSESVRNPDPTRPDPTLITSNEVISEVPRKRATRIPDPFIVTAEMKEWAAERVPLVVVKESTERFVNHWRAKAGRDATKLDWPATWRNWLIKDQDDRTNRKLTPTERAAQTATAGRQVAGRQITSLDPKEVTA